MAYGPRSYGPPAYGPPPQWRPPRRRNGSVLVGVLAALGLLTFLGVGLIVVVALATRGSASPQPPPVAVSSSATPQETTPSFTPESPSPSETPGQSHQADSGRAKNAVYKAGALPATTCPTRAEDLHSTAAVRAHLHRLFHCLDRAWDPTLARAGMRNETLHAVLTAGSGRGACGAYPPTGSGVPYYCASNNTIYASIKAVAREYGRTPGYDSAAIDSLFAHEYGHHVQNMTGIMRSYDNAVSEAGEAKQLGLSRRLELQATCFAGMFMHAVRGSYPIGPGRENTLVLFNSNVGDWGRGPRNHGTPAHNGMWYKQGYDRTKAYQCNTWTINGSYTS